MFEVLISSWDNLRRMIYMLLLVPMMVGGLEALEDLDEALDY